MSDERMQTQSIEEKCIDRTYQCLEAMNELKRKLSLLDLFCYQNFYNSKIDRTYETNMFETMKLVMKCEEMFDETMKY